MPQIGPVRPKELVRLLKGLGFAGAIPAAGMNLWLENQIDSD